MARNKRKTRNAQGSTNAAAKTARTTRLFIALQTVQSSKDEAVTPTLKRLAEGAITKLLVAEGPKTKR